MLAGNVVLRKKKGSCLQETSVSGNGTVRAGGKNRLLETRLPDLVENVGVRKKDDPSKQDKLISENWTALDGGNCRFLQRNGMTRAGDKHRLQKTERGE